MARRLAELLTDTRTVRAAFLLPTLAFAACTTKDPTELVVTVWSDFSVPSEMDSLRIRVAGKQDSKDHPFPLTSTKEPGKYSIPVQLALVPAGPRDLPITVSAIGSLGGTDMVWQQAALPFIPDQAHELSLYLARSCKNITCQDHPGFTCEAGACARPVQTSTASLPVYVPGHPPVRPDAAAGGAMSDAAAGVDLGSPDLADVRSEGGNADTARDAAEAGRSDGAPSSATEVQADAPGPDAVGTAEVADARVAPDVVVVADLTPGGGTPDTLADRIPDSVAPDMPADRAPNRAAIDAAPESPPDSPGVMGPETGRDGPAAPDLPTPPDVADAPANSDSADAAVPIPLTIQPSPLTFAGMAAGSSSPSPLTLTVCNQAATDATMASLTITGTDASDFTIVNDPISNQTLRAQANPCAYVPVRLSIPTEASPGALTASLAVSATVAGVVYTARADLVGAVVTGAVISASFSGPFADSAIGNFTGPVTLTVANTGGTATDVLDFEIPNENVGGVLGDFFIDTSLHPELELSQGTCVNHVTQLAAGASCALNIWFMPTAMLGIVQRNAILVVSSSAGGVAVVNLTARATSQLSITPAGPIVIGPTVFADSAGPTVALTIANHGGVDITSENLSLAFVNHIGQTGAGLFRVASGTTCGSQVLGRAGSSNPPDTCIVNVQMFDSENPPVPGVRSATFEATNHGNGTQKASVVVNGTAVAAPNLAFTEGSLVDRDFGPVSFGTSSRTLKFTVLNKGGMQANAMTVSIRTPSNPDGGDVDLPVGTTGDRPLWIKSTDFTVSGCTGDGASLAPRATCDISVTFNPTKCQVGAANCEDTGRYQGSTVNVKAELWIHYSLKGVTQAVQGPTLKASPPVNATTAPYVVDTSGTTTGLAPYDFGLFAPGVGALSAKVTLAVHNDTESAFAVPALVSILVTTVEVDAGLSWENVPNEFSVSTGGQAGDCLPNGETVLQANQNQWCRLVVTWTPAGGAAAVVGTREVSIRLGSGPSINVIGRVPTWPNLVAISPFATAASPMSFQDAVINTASAPLSVTIQNQGERASDGDLKVVVPSTGDGTTGLITNAVTSTGCQGTGSQIGAYPSAASTCVLVARVTPAQLGAQASADALKIQQVNDSATLLHLYATWNGINAAKISRTPSTTVDFDAASASGLGTEVLSRGTKAEISLTNNAGAEKTGPLTFSLDNDDYAIDLNPQDDASCLYPASTSDGLQPGQVCVVTIIFSPTALLATPPSTATLTIRSENAATVTVPLAGTPIPALSVSIASGDTVYGTFTAATRSSAASHAYPVTSVSNPSAAPSQVFTFKKATGSPVTGPLSTAISGAASDQFAIADNRCLGTSLSDGTPGTSDQCKITVRFAPTSTGAKAAVLTVLDPASGTPADSSSLSLRGTANP
jgi:hypothetical protein